MFKKNEPAFYVTAWNDTGTFVIYPVLVASCGKRQATLVHAQTGKMLGRHFAPAEQQNGFGKIVRENPEQVALEQAAAFLANQRAHFERCLANVAAGLHYIAAIQKGAAELHEPRVIWG